MCRSLRGVLAFRSLVFERNATPKAVTGATWSVTINQPAWSDCECLPIAHFR